MTDLKSDGSASKREVIMANNKKQIKILPFSTVPEVDLKKIKEVGAVLENLEGHAGWLMVKAWMEGQHSSRALLMARRNKTLDDKMSQVEGFDNLKSWVLQKITEGLQANEIIQQRIKEVK